VLPRQIVVLTDGQVTNTDAVIALARTHSDVARIFTFGIGAGASHHLVSALARAGGGLAEFIYPGERIEPKVVRLFGRLLSPSLTNVRINWGRLDVIAAPSVAPPVFAGGRLLLYGLVKDLEATTLRLTADEPSGTLAFELPVDPQTKTSGRTVATLAARARIRELEESTEWTSGRGSRQLGRKRGSATDEIVSLSVQYGLMSRETSYVAIERRETPVTGNMELRRVPVALTTGWGGVAQSRSGAAASMYEAGSFVLGAASLALGDEAQYRGARAASARSGSGVMGLLRRVMRSADAEPSSLAAGANVEMVPIESRAATRRPLHPDAARTISSFHAIVALQRANGSWDLTPEFAAAIGADLARIEALLPVTAGDRGETRRAWATALALAWLDRHAADAAGQWRLLADKARAWLSGVDSTAIRAFTDAAEMFFNSR
jgi:Ca-activated chloride channel family protein